MKVVRTVRELRALTSGDRIRDRRLALVPTMGALHEGHLRLLDLARERAATVAVSIFVNPTQFGPGEDFDSYPRDLKSDLELAEARGVDLVFAPDASEVYPEGASPVTVDPGAMADRLCGAYRPGHFRGVLTVVAKLFGLLRPEVAVFGRKDFQQLVLIRRMVEDFQLGVEVVEAPTVREDDGLAMSSRNRNLSSEERKVASLVYRGLEEARQRFQAGEIDAERLIEFARSRLDESPVFRTQYVELVDPLDLRPLEEAREGSVLAVAVFCGSTRLIDNVTMDRGEESEG